MRRHDLWLVVGPLDLVLRPAHDRRVRAAGGGRSSSRAPRRRWRRRSTSAASSTGPSRPRRRGGPAKNGNMEPVRRIMVDAGEHYWGRLWRPLYDSLAGNPLAAMPSLHFGTSVMAAHVLSDVGRGHGALGWTYAATLGFALVYLGEHYVVDLLAGLTLAEAVRLGARAAVTPTTPTRLPGGADREEDARVEEGANLLRDRRRLAYFGLILVARHRRDLRRVPEDRRLRGLARQDGRRHLVLDRGRDRLQRRGVRRLRRALQGHPGRQRRREGQRAARLQGQLPDHDGRPGRDADLLGRRRGRARRHLLGAAQGRHGAPPRRLPDGRVPRAHLRLLPRGADRLRRAAAHRASCRAATRRAARSCRPSSRASCSCCSGWWR